MSTSSVFLAKRELHSIPDLFVGSEGSSVGITATGNQKRTLSIVSRASRPKKLILLRTPPFWGIWAPFYHHGNGDAAAPARPRYLKPCPGVPGIHLNADRTVSMTAALLCGAGASPVHKDRGCSADHDQIEDHAHAQRHAWETLLWLKNGAHGRRGRLARARTP